MEKNSHLTRQEYRQKHSQKSQLQNKEMTKTALRGHDTSQTRADYRQLKLNFWDIFADRPYVAVAIVVLAIFLVMAKLWWLLAGLAVIVAIGIFVIGRSHHPDRVLSLEFKMKSSRKLSMLRALQFGGSIIMFLATYMKKVVTVNFSTAGSTDGLQIVQGILSNRGGVYGQQGSYFLSLLNTLTGGQLWGKYRYATNSAQMMNSSAGRLIIMWILLLMIAPAFCVLAQFFREPYSRNTALAASIVATISFVLTPRLLSKWIVEYAVENRMASAQAQAAISVGPMAYVAIFCAILVLVISIYRVIKKDRFV
ncbi:MULTISPECIES: cytochrome C5 [Lactobacillus]|uniref:cytochrome C5 n=1 Tax=Lactobacillus TaxID=1578 RepID=UPI000EFCEB0E|nr:MULTISPECIES: cytochrome C5 [Lactobacillus]MBC6349779.1 cytochrome C5 [Lactobacillus melliventris]RMC58836.1 cytochrome C5 [Lactobacillus sp. ESL0259]